MNVCSGGLFDDQLQEFGISVCLRFKERGEKRTRRKKVEERETGRGRGEVEGQLNKGLFGCGSRGQGLEGRKYRNNIRHFRLGPPTPNNPQTLSLTHMHTGHPVCLDNVR